MRCNLQSFWRQSPHDHKHPEFLWKSWPSWPKSVIHAGISVQPEKPKSIVHPERWVFERMGIFGRHRDLGAAGRVGAGRGARPQVADHRPTVLAGRVEVADLLPGALQDPVGPVLHVVGQHVRDFDLLAHGAPILGPLHNAFARLAIALRELAGSTQDQIGHRVIVVGDGLAAQAACLQRDRPAAGKGVEQHGRLAAVGRAHQLAGNVQHSLALLVFRVAGLPLDQAAIVEHLGWLGLGVSLTLLERQATPVTTWPQRSTAGCAACRGCRRRGGRGQGPGSNGGRASSP